MDATDRTTPPIGAPAPDFSLPDTHGTPVTLSGLRGGPAVLVFVPFAFSATCTGELCQLRDNIKEFEEAGVHVVVISCDPGHALRAWAAQEGFGFDLVSDFWPHGEVAREFEVFDEAKGCPRRSSYVIDRDGMVRWAVHNAMPEGRDLDEHLRQLHAAVDAPV